MPTLHYNTLMPTYTTLSSVIGHFQLRTTHLSGTVIEVNVIRQKHHRHRICNLIINRLIGCTDTYDPRYFGTRCLVSHILHSIIIVSDQRSDCKVEKN